MAIISFSRDTVVEFVPEAEREQDNPTIIKMKFVSYSMVEAYAKSIERKAIEAVRGVKDVEKRIAFKSDIAREIQKRQFCENVVAVENYMVDGKPVTDAETLYDTADAGLIEEILRAMESSAKLSEGQRKN